MHGPSPRPTLIMGRAVGLWSVCVCRPMTFEQNELWPRLLFGTVVHAGSRSSVNVIGQICFKVTGENCPFSAESERSKELENLLWQRGRKADLNRKPRKPVAKRSARPLARTFLTYRINGFWPTVLSVEPMVQYVVCLSVCLWRFVLWQNGAS